MEICTYLLSKNRLILKHFSYLARYKPLDSALTPNLKYTGFLIARVDRDRLLQLSGTANGASSSRGIAVAGFGTIYSQATRRSRRSEETAHFIISPSSFVDASANRQQRQRITTSRRQLSNIDPAYGFSDYFKPVILQEHEDDGSALEIFLIILFLLMFIALSSASVLYFLHKKGMIKEMCPKQKNHDLLRPGAPPKPITVDDLPEEYILRHRDSDYQFTQEFEMLPRGKNLSHTVSERNARKNRYNDIKACDATRVCLRKIPGDNGSDYINANFIKGYHNQKTFIASQGPLEHTVGDFWRMIWEQGCKIIIMVTNLRERGREQCAKYWPEESDEPLRFRNFSIRAVESIYYADYAVREFELCDTDSPPTTLDGGGNTSSTNGGAKLASSVVGLNSIDCRVSPTFYSTVDDSKQPVVAGGYGVATTNGGIGSGMSSMLKNSSIMSWSSSALKESDQAESFTSSRMDSDYANVSSIIRSHSKNSNHQTAETDFIKERRRVVQYHFTSWNDYKAPECTMSLLRLICRLRKLEEYNNSPVVVHCSAGVGRTGTLIAIDYVMDQCEAEGRADVFNCVAELRQQRNLMVQSVEQYVFIYKALAEFQLFGNTDMTIAEFSAFYNGRLRQPVYLSKERERHFSVGSSRSSARSNSIIGAQSVLGCGGGGGAISSSEAEKSTPPPPATTSTTTVATTTTKDHSSGSGSGALVDHGLTNAMAISAGLRARLRQLRTGLSGSGGTASTAPLVGGTPTTQSTCGGSIAAMVGSVSTKPTHLEAQFMNLSISLEKTRPFDWSKKPENVTRNRFPDVVPYNVNRVILAPLIGYDNTYINASIVKGYFYPYILAQDPLDAETVFDFWRMIHDNNSYTLVMLSTEADFNRSEKYWPEDTEKKLILGKNGELVVTMLQQHEIPPICLFRRLHYRFKTDKNSAGREVVQFAFRQWKSGQPVPSSASALLELIGRVLERQSNIPDAGPIILHCRNGSSENGVFCCLSLLLERLKSEQMVDIFRTVKSLQLQRPLLFTKLEQYAFCYDCVTEYINSSQ